MFVYVCVFVACSDLIKQLKYSDDGQLDVIGTDVEWKPGYVSRGGGGRARRGEEGGGRREEGADLEGSEG